MVSIRLIQPTDWQGLYNLIDSVDKSMVGMYSSTEELVEDWINTIDMGIWEVHVAVLPPDERKKPKRKIFPRLRLKTNTSGIIGVITLYADWEYEEDIEKGEFDIGITVAKQYQQKGIGKRLLNFIIDRGKELKLEKATLWTRVDNIPMIKLAQRMGFQQGKSRTKHGFDWIQFVLELNKEKEED
ncbi:MAG: GNAT family N-acetyltransferase [Asgard group archaeon]|nr:GNAT family N-acetyltransferase [Asgard group archaeon]